MKQVEMVKDPWLPGIFTYMKTIKNQPNVDNKYQSHGWIYGKLVTSLMDPMVDG